MGDVNHEPTMEEILASIKTIIAEDAESAIARRSTAAPTGPDAVAQGDIEADKADAEILELTETVDAEDVSGAAVTAPEPEKTDLAHEDATNKDTAIVSDSTTEASRAALAALSAISNADGKTSAAGSRELDEMVRDMLRPMLKDWLDQNLPGMVKEMVAREIARIAGASD